MAAPTEARRESSRPPSAASKLPKVAPLSSIASLPDGRLIAGGEGGLLLVSEDDGVTFTVLAHKLKTERAFHSAVSFGGAVYAHGHGDVLARIG